MGIWLKRLLLLVVVAGLVSAIVVAFLPKPVKVDLETVQSGPMEVSVRDDGRTRIRERYVVSTPIAGRLKRIDFEVGDRVTAGETVVARMDPTAPNLLDPRELAKAQARVKAAEGRLKRSETELARAQAELDQALVNLDREQDLRKKNASTSVNLEQAQLDTRVKSELVKAAEFQQEISRFELELEQAGLLHVTREAPSSNGDSEKAPREFEITSPITGRVLRVIQQSSAVVSPGEPLLELGDPSDLEVVVDVLSSDAVRIQPGQTAWFERWGGPQPLMGSVRLVEPSGFTKVSALGVEEQRVNVVLDFIGSPGDRQALGDGYRVEARIVVWSSSETISVPTGALFRDGEDWSVFVVQDGVARLRHVTVGENNGLRVQILQGLEVGEQLILHPGDQVADGAKVEVRESR